MPRDGLGKVLVFWIDIRSSVGTKAWRLSAAGPIQSQSNPNPRNMAVHGIAEVARTSLRLPFSPLQLPPIPSQTCFSPPQAVHAAIIAGSTTPLHQPIKPLSEATHPRRPSRRAASLPAQGVSEDPCGLCPLRETLSSLRKVELAIRRGHNCPITSPRTFQQSPISLHPHLTQKTLRL